MTIEEINEHLKNAKIDPTILEDDEGREGLDFLFHFYNIPSLRKEVHSLGGLSFKYLDTTTFYEETEGEVQHQHIFLLDNYLLAVDFHSSSWDNGWTGTEAYPVIAVKINITKDQQVARYVRL